MRSAIWLLAVCGISGLAVCAIAADERPVDDDWSFIRRSDSTKARQFFSRNQEKDADEESEKSDSKKAQPNSEKKSPSRYFRRKERLRRRKPTRSAVIPGVKNYHKQLFGTAPPLKNSKKVVADKDKARPQIFGPTIYEKSSDKNSRGRLRRIDMRKKFPHFSADPKKSSGVTHADHQKKEGTPVRGKIQRVRASDERPNPFRIAEELSKQKRLKSRVRRASSRPAKRRTRLAAGRTAAKKVSQPPATSVKSYKTAIKTGPQTPMISIEWVRRSNISVGEECRCDLLVRNSGKVTAVDVVVDAYFPNWVRLTDAKPSPSEKEEYLSWRFGSLVPGEEKTIELSMIPSRRGELETTAYVRFTGSASGRFTVAEPVLKIVLKGPTKVSVGDPASQTLMISNVGTGVANNVTVEAIIPKGLEHPRGGRLSIEIGALNAGETRSVRLPLTTLDGGEQILHIEAKADAAKPKKLAYVIDVIAPSVKLVLDGPKLRYSGRKAKYTLTITNSGSASANNLRVLHKVPEGFNFKSADKGGTFDASNRTASWFVGQVEPGASLELKIVLVAGKLGNYVHRAGAISEQGTRSETELDTVVDGTASLVIEILDLDDPVEIGTETAYEVRVRNDGSKAAQDVKLECELPEGVEFISARGPAKYSVSEGIVSFRAVSRLAPGKAAIYRVRVKGLTEGNHRFRARLNSKSIPETLNFDELTRFYAD